MISERLDFLMKVTDTKNSALGRALSFDPSYIGRIRSGKRGLPKHFPFVEPAAAFFARNIKNDYQKKVISEVVLNGQPLPEDRETLEKLLVSWLNDDGKASSGLVERLLNELTAIKPPKNLAELLPEKQASLKEPKKIRSQKADAPDVYIGNAGKRAAVNRFFTELLAEDKPHALDLFSDEDMSWLFEDPVFAKGWALSLIKLLSRGSRIRIIHSLNRNLNEMLEAVKKWLPVYISGDITPYYYPRLRDGIYHRTLFLAKGKCAIISNSIHDRTEDMANFYVRKAPALDALSAEFESYLALCAPLMSIFRTEDEVRLRECLAHMQQSKGALYLATASTVRLPVENVLPVPPVRFLIPQLPKDTCILAKEGCGVLVISHSLIFDIREPQLTMSMLEYMTLSRDGFF